jgi:hypothetical protein
MGNLLGDFFTGSTMVGGDPDTPTNPFAVTITGKTRFSGRLLVTSVQLGATIIGHTVVTGTIVQLARDELTGVIIGKTDFTGTVLSGGAPTFEGEIDGHTIVTGSLTIPAIPQLSGSIVGKSRFINPGFATAMQADFFGEVGAQGERTMTTHGEVLSGTGAKYPTIYEDERQPVPHFV